MIASPAEIARLRAFFDSADIPKQLKLDAASLYVDVPFFIEKVLTNLQNDTISERVMEPLYQKLLLIEKRLKEGE